MATILTIGLVFGLVVLAGYFLYLDSQNAEPMRYTRVGSFPARQRRVEQPETRRRAA